MIYYYYGINPESDGVLRASEMPAGNSSVRKYGELVIEDDTIYEIDEACLNCKRKREREK